MVNLAMTMLTVLVALSLRLASATDYTVGTPNGSWDTSTSLDSWASSQKFMTGDTLTFRYTPQHNVVEVSKADYDSCSGSNPIITDSSGTTKVQLKSPGKRYFICGVPGHCDAGMKMAVNVLAAHDNSTAASSAPSPFASSSFPGKAALSPALSSAPSQSPISSTTPSIASAPTMFPAEGPSAAGSSPASNSAPSSANHGRFQIVAMAVALGFIMFKGF